MNKETGAPETKVGDTGSSTGPELSFRPIESQEELNRLAGERVTRERAKFADYDDLKAKAAQMDAFASEQKTVEDKAKEREATAIQRAEAAEAKAVRREVALEHKLTATDAALLDGVADEDAMRALAKRLAEAGGDDGKSTGPALRFTVPGQGTGSAKSTTLTGRERAQAYLEKHKI